MSSICGILAPHKKGVVVGERPIKLFTLCFVLDGNRILQGENLTGTFWLDDVDAPDAKILRYEIRVTEEGDDNEATRSGYPHGAVMRGGSKPLQNPKTGLWTRRDTEAGRFTSVKREGGTFRGIRREDSRRMPMWLCWLRKIFK